LNVQSDTVTSNAAGDIISLHPPEAEAALEAERLSNRQRLRLTATMILLPFVVGIRGEGSERSTKNLHWDTIQAQ
jgi:hypothetical protein